MTCSKKSDGSSFAWKRQHFWKTEFQRLCGLSATTNCISSIAVCDQSLSVSQLVPDQADPCLSMFLGLVVHRSNSGTCLDIAASVFRVVAWAGGGSRLQR